MPWGNMIFCVRSARTSTDEAFHPTPVTECRRLNSSDPCKTICALVVWCLWYDSLEVSQGCLTSGGTTGRWLFVCNIEELVGDIALAAIL